MPFMARGTSSRRENGTKAAKSPRLSAKECFANPEGCGYPGPNTTGPGGEGVAKCSSLTPSGSKTISTSGEKVENQSITGTLLISASNVTVNNVCVTDDGGDQGEAVTLSGNATGVTISNSVVRGKNTTTESIQESLRNVTGHNATATKDYFYNCGDCVWGEWTLTKSFVYSSGEANVVEGPAEGHQQAHLSQCTTTDATESLTEDTLWNPAHQSAVVFGNVNEGGGDRAITT